MTTDFDTTLRDRLTDAADHAPVDLDLDRILDAGHAGVRRQTRQRVLLGSVAAVAVLAAGWAGIGMNGLRATPVPAAPSGPSAPAATATLTFDLAGLSVGSDPATLETRTLKVDINPAAEPGTPGVRYHWLAADGHEVLSTGTSIPPAGQATWGSGDPAGFLVGVINARVDWWASEMPTPNDYSTPHAFVSNSQIADNLGLTVVIGRQQTPTDAGTVDLLVYRPAGTAEYHNHTGARLPSASFDFDGKQVTVAFDRPNSWIGLCTTEGCEATTRALGEASLDHHLLSTWNDKGAGGSSGEALVAGVLPRGAHGLVWTSLADGSAQMTEIPSTGETVYVAHATNVPDTFMPVLTYLDADGRTVTVKN